MRRSGDVTAAAIVLFFGSGVCLLLMLPLGAAIAVDAARHTSRASEFVPLLLSAALAFWGIVTGVGILKLRPWAWVSTIVMSGVGVFVSFFLVLAFARLPSLLADSGLPAASVRPVALGGCFLLLGAAAIAIWWVVLFTRDRVRSQFSGYPGTAVGGAGFSSEMPTSILVICILSLVGVSFLLLSFQLIFREHLPLVIFGVLASGGAVIAYGLVLIVAQTVLSIFTLRRRTWALDGMVWFAAINIVNAVAFFISPAKDRFFSVMSPRDVSEGVNPQALQQLRQTIGYGGELFGICVGLICLYFLLTRRRAFRAACAPPNSNSNASAPATPDPEIAP